MYTGLLKILEEETAKEKTKKKRKLLYKKREKMAYYLAGTKAKQLRKER